jgi:hypothetical protein
MELWSPRDPRAGRGAHRLGLLVLQLDRMVPRKGVDTVIRGVAALLRDYAISSTSSSSAMGRTRR